MAAGKHVKQAPQFWSGMCHVSAAFMQCLGGHVVLVYVVEAIRLMHSTRGVHGVPLGTVIMILASVVHFLADVIRHGSYTYSMYVLYSTHLWISTWGQRMFYLWVGV